MIKIMNINENYGDQVTFVGSTLEECEEAMERAIEECGDAFSDVTVTSDDYIILQEDL